MAENDERVCMMDAVEDVLVEPLRTGSSQFVRPLRMYYKQDKKKKIWDLVSLHDSVAIILYNKDRQKLIVVKQFRPAVYYSCIPREEREAEGHAVDCSKYPGERGVTLELCAGIVDKRMTLEEVAKEEVLEECGYDVPLKNFEHVKTCRSGTGVSGDKATIFYAEVTDQMKVTEGGGAEEEGEMIQVVEMGLDEVRKLLNSPEVNAPGAFLYGMTWFMLHKAPSGNAT